MATITTNTYLDGGVARTAGEAWNMNGGILTVRTDTRWHANSPASMTGSLGAVTISSTLGGGVLLDGRNVRQVLFNSGSGVVPAIGTIVTQGGVSGYLLGVWANLTSAPTAVGAAMPTSGFIKFREVTGGNFSAGLLVGIVATATGADTTSWIEVVQRQAVANIVPRLGSFKTRGDWFYLDDATGAANQILQIPTNGGGSGTHVPAVWIETAAGSGVYEIYPAVLSTWFLAANLGTDNRSKFVQTLGNGQLRIGYDGTANAGYVPPAGCKIRIPNVLGRQSASGTDAVNQVPNATLATRPDFTTTSAGEIDFEFFLNDWYHLFSAPFKVRMINTATFDSHSTSNEASPTELDNYAIGAYIAGISLTLLNNSLGGTITNCRFVRPDAASGGHSISVTGCSNYIFTGVRTGVIQYARSTGAVTFSQCRNLTFNNFIMYCETLVFSTCSNVLVKNLNYIDRILGVTDATTGKYAVQCTVSCDNIMIDGVILSYAADLGPYLGVFNASNSSNLTFRNVGTFNSPVDVNAAQAPAYIFQDSGNCDTIRVQRCYLEATRTNNYVTLNTSKNITIDNCLGTVGSVQNASNNTLTRGLRTASNSVVGAVAVYGSHWADSFDSDILGRVWLAFNEATAFSASQYQAISLGVGAGFTSAGQIVMPNIGDEIIFTMPYFCIGHTAFANIAPTLTGTNTGNFAYTYDIDTGSGFSGSYKTLNAANLSAEIISPSVGFKLKFRIVTVTFNAGNALTYIRVSTVSTAVAQAAALYPLDLSTIKLTGLRAGSRVQIYDTTNSVELFNDIVAGTSLSYEAPYVADYSARVRIMYATTSSADVFIEFSDTVTINGLSRSVVPKIDAIYVANAINGFAVTGIAINDAALLIETLSGTFSWSQIYAYETAWLFSAVGIRDEGRFITAIDNANYKLDNFKIKNVSSPSVPLIITGGWGRDSVTNQTSTLIDVTGGTIFSNPDLVISFATGSGLSPSEQATLSKIDTLTENSSGLRFTTKALEAAPSGGGGGGGGATAADVWSYATRSLTTAFPTVPTAAQNASQVRTELSVELARLDAAISTRLATAGYTAPTSAPTVSQIRTEMDSNSTKLSNLDATVSSRLASAGYTAPDNAGVAAIKAKTDQLAFTSGNVNSIAQVVSDKTGYALTSGEKTAIATAVEAALINDGDGQALINAIVTSIGNQNIDQVVLVAAIRADIERVGGMLTGKASQSSVNAIPTDGLSTTDSRLNNLDATISSRMTQASYTAPSAVPTAAQNASAVRSEIGTELARIDVAISTRNAVEPDNATIQSIDSKSDSIKQNTDLIPAAL